MDSLKIGNENKRTDLHDAFGGQTQGGISTPAKHKLIFIFSNDSGGKYGYEDGWQDSNCYLYSGQGRIGDMTFTFGNRSIRDHKLNGKTIHLFTKTVRSHVRYEGELNYLGHEYIRTHDQNGKARNAIKFILTRDDAVDVHSNSNEYNKNKTAKHREPNKTERKGLVTSRVGQGYYRNNLLAKFNYVCAVTGGGPQEILIASHIVPWRDSTDQERLDPENGILLSAAYDALFDKYFISFKETGEIICSNLISKTDRLKIGLSGSEKISVTDGMKPFLAKHRKRLR